LTGKTMNRQTFGKLEKLNYKKCSHIYSLFHTFDYDFFA
jgi:hypothetical protein